MNINDKNTFRIVTMNARRSLTLTNCLGTLLYSTRQAMLAAVISQQLGFCHRFEVEV